MREPRSNFPRNGFYGRARVFEPIVTKHCARALQTPFKPPKDRIRWQGAGFEPIVTKHCARAYTNPVQTSGGTDSMAGRVF